MNRVYPFIAAAAAVLFVSCQGSDPRAAAMNYSDAVTRLDQVDPAYRAYFRDQQGSNYGVEEQRKAIAAAVQTARTPVPTHVNVPAERPLAQRRSTSAARQSVAARGKVSAKRRLASAKGKSAAGKKNVAKSKAPVSKKKSGKALAANTKKRR